MGRKFFAFLFLLIFLPGCGDDTPQAPPPPVVVKTLAVELTDQVGSTVYSGSVRGRYESNLGFQVGGRISARHIDLGDQVTAGTILLEIDPQDLQESVRIAAAQVDSARSQLHLAETDFRRYERLYKDGAVSRAQYDQFQTSFDAATESVHQAEAQYNQAENALSYSRLAADSDGVISSLQAEVGQVVAAGQPLVTLVRSGDLEVEISIPENRIAYIHQQQRVSVTFWALPDIKISGTVREVSPMADMATRTYTVRVSLDSPPPEVQLGMTASVEAWESGDTGGKVALVPLTALYQTDDKAHVWLVKDGRVRLFPVTAHNFDENRVAVTEGLMDGDVLVVAGVHKLHDGQEVRLMDQVDQGES